MKNKFYINWLKIACILAGLFGLISAAASTESGSGIWLFLFDLLKWPVDNDPAMFQEESFAVNAVLGSVMIGWATLMYFLIKGPISKGNIEIVKYILIALIVWFLIDSTGSILAGLPGNVILNLSFLIIFIPPLIGLMKNTKKEKKVVL